MESPKRDWSEQAHHRKSVFFNSWTPDWLTYKLEHSPYIGYCLLPDGVLA